MTAPDDLSILPDYLWVNIFKYVGWKDLVNVRLTCKKFDVIVHNKDRYMQKAKLCFLDVNFLPHLNSEEEIRITYKICNESYGQNCVHHDRVGKKSLCYTNLEDYRNFLRGCDYTKLYQLSFGLYKDTNALKLFNEYYTPGDDLKYVFLEDYCDRVRKDPIEILNFISNIRDTEYMNITLNFENGNLPKDFKFPAMRSLKKFCLFENNGTNFVTPEMAIHLIHNSKDGCIFNLHLNNENLYEDITESLFRRCPSRYANGCRCRSYTLRFYRRSPFTDADRRFYDNHFVRNNYFHLYYADEQFSQYNFVGSKECYRCHMDYYQSYNIRSTFTYLYDCWNEILFLRN
uniref:F-box domain-containing protein n=1 Tax=Strongyloides papillosus TaxID=174720 RepID=A0A0N5BQE0_STREA